MKKITLSLLLLAVCLTGCRNRGADDELPVFDIQRAIDTSRPFDLTEIADRFEFIALEDTDDESLVGSITAMQESQSRFYLSDGPRNPVKVFDKAGKFVSTRGQIGRGPNELTYIEGMAVDYREDHIYLSGGKKTVAYDTEGLLIARNDSISSPRIACHDGEWIMLDFPFDAAYGGSNLLRIYSSDLQPERELKFTVQSGVDLMIEIGGRSYWFYGAALGLLSDNGKAIFVKEPWNDTVYHYEKARPLEPVYRLDMGRYFIPAQAYGEEAAGTWSGEAYYRIDNIFDGNRYLITYLSSQSGGGLPPAFDCLIFEKNDLPGGFSAVGPNGQNGLFIDGIGFTPMYIRDNRLVGYMNAIDIVDNADAITNPDLKAVADNMNEDSNPVIVVATLKR
jgi:hypothetical protein